MPKMVLRVVFLVGGDSAATRSSIAAVCRLAGIQPVAILLDTDRNSLSARYRNLRRNIRRNGWGYLSSRFAGALHGITTAAVENVFPRRDIEKVLRLAFPDECFDLHSLAAVHGMELIEAGNLNSPAAAAALSRLNADLGIVLGTRVLRRGTFAVPRLGSINLHKGAVPKYRGMPPGFWEIYNSETTAGVTVHFVDDSLDTGDIVAVSEVAISPLDTPETLLTKLHLAGDQTLAEAVTNIKDGEVAPIAQKSRAEKPHTRPTRRQVAELERRLPHWRRANPLKETLKNVWMLTVYYSGLFALARVYHRLGNDRGAVILYHRVNDVAPYHDPLTTSRARFAGHALMLSRWYKPMITSDMVRSIREHHPLAATSVAVHFDDCYRDVNQSGCRILRACGLPGTAFISSGFVGTARVFAHDTQKSPFRFENLTQLDLSHMLADGFEIGAHTVNHVDLGSIPLPQAESEISESIRALSGLTGSPITMFSFPFGRETNIRQELRQAVREAGAECMFSAYGGFVNSKSDPYDIPRFGASSMHTPLALALELECLMPRNVAGLLRRGPKPSQSTAPTAPKVGAVVSGR
jgi:peptidoglycan/xylan/chitin deacetylase (PgdA/CDA1 family)